ncbi:MAG: ABC transporter ATP-binding protein [Longimicrobiales bacterium]
MHHLRTLIPFLRPYRWATLAGLVLVAFSNVFDVLVPLVLGRAIDALGEADMTRTTILGYAFLIVGLALLAGTARFGMRVLLNGMSRHIENDLRNAFFDHLLRLDATFYGGTRTGDLMSRATNDVGAVRMAVGPAVMYLVNTAFSTGLALFFMTRISGRLTLLALIPLLLMPPVVIVAGRIIHERFERIQEHLGVLSTMVQENLSGVRIVRAYAQEAAQEREFDDLNRTYFDKNMDLARTSALFHPTLSLLAAAAMLIVFWFGGRLVMSNNITPGDFVAFLFYLAKLSWPMIALGWVINLFQRGAASMGRLNTVFSALPRVTPPAHPTHLSKVKGEVEFRDVWFRYPGTERDVLQGINFRIPTGQTTAIVGPTGSGKSTVVALLARRYDPTAGAVTLDAESLPTISFEQLRQAIAVVPQEAFVFSETIADNLALGLPRDAHARDDIVEAARMARFDEAIALFPRGFETRLGERGVNLSGGQRQRATLARAIARNPRVLILDDALSAVDTHTETEILENLKQVLAGRTAVIISHRVSAVMNADQILVLDQGIIVERGTHAQLIARGGLYATLLRRQLLEESVEGELANSSEPA